MFRNKMPGYGAGYVRLMRKRRTSKTAKRSTSSKYSKSTAERRRLVRLIKRTVMRKTELKEKTQNAGKTEVYHNCFYSGTLINTGFVWPLNSHTVMPTQGTADDQRVGDEIEIVGFKLRFLLGQKADRPNVNWRFNVLSVPKGSSITYANWYQLVTGNVMLDDPNRDFVKTLKSEVWRPNEAGLVGGQADEYTFTKKMWIPYKKHLKFGPAGGATTHNDDDLYVVLMAYDAYGAAVTDNIGYVQMAAIMCYRDP